MIKGWESYTYNLSDEEYSSLGEIVLSILKNNEKIIFTNSIIREIIYTKYNLKVADSKIRAVLNLLRKDAEPIAASEKGYWYTEDIDELEAYLESSKQRINSQIEKDDGMRRAIIRIKKKRMKEAVQLQITF